MQVKHHFKGVGSKESPYIIATKEDLVVLQQQVNKGNSFFEKHFILSNDIEMQNLEWTPIGNAEKVGFAGKFDGSGYSINNLIIEAKSDYVGIFGNIYASNDDNTIHIQNLNTKNVKLIIKNRFSKNVGALVGMSNASISNCNVEASIYVQNSQYSNLGGIVGSLNGDLTNCSSSGTISIETTEYHNLAGYNDGLWAACGGLVGTINGNLQDLLNNMEIIFTKNQAQTSGYIISHITGGVVGSLNDGDYAKNCINTAPLISVGSIGGVFGSINIALELSDCNKSGNIFSVSEIYLNVGGLIALCNIRDTVILNSYNTGKVKVITQDKAPVNTTETSFIQAFVGGIAGSLKSKIFACFNNGEVDVGGSNNHYVGGIVGVVQIAERYGEETSIKFTYSACEIQAKNGVGGGMFSNQLAGGIMGYNMDNDNIIQSNYFDITLIQNQTTKSNYVAPVYWYGEESEAENVDGIDIRNNLSLITEMFFSSVNLQGFLEYVDSTKTIEGYVWVFNGDLPKFYYEIVN